MRQAIESSGCRVFPVFQYRYGLGLAQLSALQASGLTGRAMVASAETHWNRDGDYYAVPWRGTWQHDRGRSAGARYTYARFNLRHSGFCGHD